MLRKIIFLFITLLFVFGGYQLYLSARSTPQSLDINVVSTGSLPITSTFITVDLGLNRQYYKNLVKELKTTGIDTVIVPIGDVNKDCSNQSSPYVDNYYLTQSGRGESIFIEEALAVNLKIIFGFRSPYFIACLNPMNGTPTDVNTPMGHLIAHSLKTADGLKTYLSGKGISWTDPRIAGFYISEETDTYELGDANAKKITFLKELSSRLVSYGKPIMLSPYQQDSTDYARSLQAYNNIIRLTNVTIIAPQDSMGSGKTSNIANDKNHFRALADAKTANPTKNVEVWANIELFQMADKDPTYSNEIPGTIVKNIPAPFSRVQQQIEAARPYVSKMTSWIYQHQMMVLPAANNNYAESGWNLMYTPGLATRRAKLRSDYLAAYGGATVPTPTPSTTPMPSPSTPSATCNKLYYYNKNTKLCVATSDTYNSSQVFCGGGNTCVQNLNLYLAGATTGVCYTSATLCQNANAYAASPTPTAVSTPTPPSGTTKKSDLNQDAKINLFDVNIFVPNYGKVGSPGWIPSDINKDGKINLKDYSVLVSEFGK